MDKGITVWNEVQCETTPIVEKQLSKQQKDQLRELLNQLDKVIRSRPGQISVTHHHNTNGNGKPVR